MSSWDSFVSIASGEDTGSGAGTGLSEAVTTFEVNGEANNLDKVFREPPLARTGVALEAITPRSSDTRSCVVNALDSIGAEDKDIALGFEDTTETDSSYIASLSSSLKPPETSAGKYNARSIGYIKV